MHEKLRRTKKATRTQIVEIHARLKEVMVKGPDDLWSYPEDMSDYTIGQDIGVATSSVRELRVECFGNLRKKTSTRTQELEEMKVLVAGLVKGYEELKDKHNRLCDQLSLNQLTKCQHLKVK